MEKYYDTRKEAKQKKKAVNKSIRKSRRVRTGSALGGGPKRDVGGKAKVGVKILIKGKEPLKMPKYMKDGPSSPKKKKKKDVYVAPTEAQMASGTKRDIISKYGKEGKKAVRGAKKEGRTSKKFSASTYTTSGQRKRLRKKLK